MAVLPNDSRLFRNLGIYFWHKFEEACQIYNDVNTEFISSLEFSFGSSIKKVANFSNFIMMPFEFLEIPIPVGYEDILTGDYGDWHKYVIGTSMHGKMIINTEIPYTKYLRENYNNHYYQED